MKGLTVVARLPYVDSTRMGAPCLVRRVHDLLDAGIQPLQDAVSHDGVFNPASMRARRKSCGWDWEFGGTPYANRTLYEKWSPLNFVQNWTTPILIVHFPARLSRRLSEGYQAFTAAKVHGVPPSSCTSRRGHWVLRRVNRRLWWERCSTGLIST